MTKQEQKEMQKLIDENTRLCEQFTAMQISLNGYGNALANATDNIRNLQLTVQKVEHEKNLLFQALTDSHKLRMQERGQAAQLKELAEVGSVVMAAGSALMQFVSEQPANETNENKN